MDTNTMYVVITAIICVSVVILCCAVFVLNWYIDYKFELASKVRDEICLYREELEKQNAQKSAKR